MIRPLPLLLLPALACATLPPGPPAGDDDDDDFVAVDDDDSAPADDDDAAPDDDDSAAPDDDDTTDPPLPVEARGVWVTRWDYSNAGHVETIFSTAAAAGFNQVFFQVRGQADAYYESTWEPWAARLSGTLGQDPGWDPLDEAIAAGRRHGLQVHAWLNTFPAWAGTTLPIETSPRHMLLEHPEWLVVDSAGQTIALNSSYVFFSPGIPGVRAHVADVAEDIAARYAVDGIHLDYIRYPGAQYSHDPISNAQFAASGWSDRGDWQRAMVTATAASVKQAVEAARPGTLVSAAVWGIYEDLWGWNSSEGLGLYQDSVAMVDEGALDVAIPMIYWPHTDPAGGFTDFALLVDFFASQLPGDQLWVGMKADYEAFAEVEREIETARAAGADGVVMFAYSTLSSRGWWDELAAGPFAEPAAAP